MEILELFLHSFVNLAMLLFEYIGVGIITYAGIQGIVNYVRHVPDTRLILAKGLAMGLEFKLGSEILRTVIVRNLEEIYIVAGIIILRAVLTFLIHWEIKTEEASGKNERTNTAETSDKSENANTDKTKNTNTVEVSDKTENTNAVEASDKNESTDAAKNADTSAK